MAKEKDPTKIPLIFEATLRLVLDEGFSGLTMAQVARQAGIATGTLYVYFKSKDDLIDQLYLAVKSKKASAIKGSIVEGESFYANFSRLWRNYLMQCYHEPQQMQFILQFCDSGYISDATKAIVAASLSPLVGMFEQAQREMLIVSIPVAAIFAHIQGSAHALAQYHLETKQILTDEISNDYFAMIWNSLRK